ncbi:MAG: L-threonylcarbamoyladenylate synthase [Patescibacteria group bacterium]
MDVIIYEEEKKAEILSQALVVLMSGGTVVYPTETAYALGADFYSPHAYRAVFEIKFRTPGKFLPVIVPDLNYARTLVRFTPYAYELATRYWPGPLTLVLPFLYHREWPHHPDPYLALRVSSHAFAANLARAFGRPLVSTSANISGKALCYNAAGVIEQLKRSKKRPDLIIDAGSLPEVEPSTIVKIDDKMTNVIRKGPIKLPKK